MKQMKATKSKYLVTNFTTDCQPVCSGRMNNSEGHFLKFNVFFRPPSDSPATR